MSARGDPREKLNIENSSLPLCLFPPSTGPDLTTTTTMLSVIMRGKWLTTGYHIWLTVLRTRIQIPASPGACVGFSPGAAVSSRTPSHVPLAIVGGRSHLRHTWKALIAVCGVSRPAAAERCCHIIVSGLFLFFVHGAVQMAQHLPNGDCPSVTSADDVAGNMATTSMSNDTPSTLLPVSLITLAVVVQSSGSFGCPSRACLTSFRKAAQHSPFYIYF
ncbi:uncharacterized protein LOC133510740 isoform X1 [Syngnathoides biaculeatus]|uniref:uncharacterized protein LOC133510740 isoform X1 n=1 Tax=Syngnathoides biaculeatus TaxID=300417 RepID=UPI002ADD711D|nr:uncharacterized protein LOC133510740 isoform X1 [Syngnathoides biaculeatus]